MDSFDVQVECPHCGAEFAVARIRAGREESCPVCSGTVRVPAAGVGGAAAAGSAGAGPGTGESPAEASPQAPAESAVAERVAFEAPAVNEWARALVCCAAEQKVNPLAAGAIVARHTGLSLSDARRQVVRGMGLLADGISMGVARQMVEELHAKGIEAFTVPVAWVPATVEERPMFRVYGADAEALRLQTDAHGASESVPWERLAAGLCTRAAFAELGEAELEVVEEPYSAGGGVIAHHVYRRKEHQPEPAARVTLVLAEGPAKASLLSFSERQVRYAYLEERLQPGHEQNFKLFLNDVLRWGGDAFFAASFRAAARGDRMHVTKVVGKVDYAHYVRWALCCAAARGKFGAAP
jgi:ribosomal protein S27E